MANNKQPSPDEDLAAKIRQVEEETRGEKNTKAREERVRALLKPLLGGRKPEELIYVCHLEHSGGSFSQHAYYVPGAEALAGAALPNPTAIPPRIAQLFRGTLEPCIQHLIEFSIGVTGAHISQKRIVPYELLPAPARNPVELEKAVAAATHDYLLTTKEVAMPTYVKETRRVVSAVLFKNALPYQSETARHNLIQLLQQVDDAISLQKEGKISEGELRELIAMLGDKPQAKIQETVKGAPAIGQQQPLRTLEQEVKADESYQAARFVVPARLENPEEINLVLKMVKLPYEVVLDASPGFGLFRFLEPGHTEYDSTTDEATGVITRLDKLISVLRGPRTKEQLRQELPWAAQRMYESVRPRQQP